MKKLGKLTLSELKNEAHLIDKNELLNYFGGSVSSQDWNSWGDNEKAQYIVNTYVGGGKLEIGGLSAGGWQTSSGGASVTVKGSTFRVVISLNSLLNDVSLGGLGYIVDDDYTNSGGTWTKVYIGSNAQLMINPQSDQTDDFVNTVLQSAGGSYNY